MLKITPPPESGHDHPIKEQEKDVMRAEGFSQGEMVDDGTDEEVDALVSTASGVREIEGKAKSTFYENSHEDDDALRLEAESAAFFKVPVHPNMVHDLYKSVVIEQAADLSASCLEDPTADDADSGRDTADDQPGASSATPQSASGDRRPPAATAVSASGGTCRRSAPGGMCGSKDWMLVRMPGRKPCIMEWGDWKDKKTQV